MYSERDRRALSFLFYSLISSYKPSVVVLFEPRISGKKADPFIKGSGYDRSHRVEAVGFKGGI